MKQVVSLIGRNAGSLVWMRPHEADQALATGVAVLPDSAKGQAVLAGADAFPEKDSTPKASDEGRVDLRIRKGDDGIYLEGEWPAKTRIPPRLLVSNMVRVSESGDVVVSIGGRTADYKAISEERSGEILIDLVRDRDAATDKESLQVAEDPDPAPVDNDDKTAIPASWQDLHWKQRVKLANELGYGVETVADADAALELHGADEA